MTKKELGKRDRDCLQWVAEQLTVSTSDFLRVVNLHPRTTKHLGYDAVRIYVSRLRQAGYVKTKRITTALPHFIYVTEKTLRALDLPFPEYEPRTLAEVELEDKTNNEKKLILLGKAIFHTDAINKARLYFEERFADVSWRSERWIRQKEREAPETKWAYRPDAHAFPNNKNTAIQVENTNKGKARLDQILIYHLMTFDQTYYFCTNAETYALVRQQVAEIDPDFEHFRLLRKSEFM